MATHFADVLLRLELNGEIFNAMNEPSQWDLVQLPLCFGFEINGVVFRLGGGGPGTVKLWSGCPWPRGAFGTSIASPGAYVMLGLLQECRATMD